MERTRTNPTKPGAPSKTKAPEPTKTADPRQRSSLTQRTPPQPSPNAYLKTPIAPEIGARLRSQKTKRSPPRPSTSSASADASPQQQIMQVVHRRNPGSSHPSDPPWGRQAPSVLNNNTASAKRADKTKVTSDSITKQAYAVPTRNSFEPISDLDDESGDDSSDQEAAKEGEAIQSTSPNPTKAAPKPPPIILRDIKNLIELGRTLKTVCKHEFEFVSRRETTKLILKDANDHRAVTKYLQEEEIEYHTFVLKEDRAQKLVIRGIDASVPEEYIQQALQEDYNITVDRVARMTSRRPARDGELPQESRGLPLFIVYTMSKETAAAIRKINKLCYSKVTVETYQSPNGPQQCYRCQRFGHTSRFCTSRPNCMKCAKGHLTRECKKPNTTAGRCSNCNGDHVACYRGCPSFQQARERQNATKQPRLKNNNNQQQNTPRYIDAPAPNSNAWQQRTAQRKHRDTREDFPMLQQQRRADGPQTATSLPPIDFEGMKQWAQTLLDALNKANQADRLAVILSHAMPMALIDAMLHTQNASTP